MEKKDFGAKPYFDVAVRYAKQIGNRFAFKVNFQAINGTDFIADDYTDRSARSRVGFFLVNQDTKTVDIGYVPNNNPTTNSQFDALNIDGDDIPTAGAFTSNASNTTKAGLIGKTVIRTSYKEIDLTGANGNIYSYRANVALHHNA